MWMKKGKLESVWKLGKKEKCERIESIHGLVFCLRAQFVDARATIPMIIAVDERTKRVPDHEKCAHCKHASFDNSIEMNARAMVLEFVDNETESRLK